MLHLTKRTRAQVPIACSIEQLERLAIFVNAFCNKALVINCCENVQYLWKKRFPCISQDMKKKNIAYSEICQNFRKLCSICYVFPFGIIPSELNHVILQQLILFADWLIQPNNNCSATLLNGKFPTTVYTSLTSSFVAGYCIAVVVFARKSSKPLIWSCTRSNTALTFCWVTRQPWTRT